MYLRTYITVLLLCLLLPALLIVAVDPYRAWHDSGFMKDLYSTNQRYQNAGLIRRFLECDDCSKAAVIVGTSLSQNTSIDDLNSATGLDNAVRLIAEGSYPIEHKYMLERALASGKVSVVFWELYRHYASPDYDQFPEHGTFPMHLYTKTRADDYPYLFNHSVFSSAAKQFTGGLNWSTDLGTLNSWHAEALATNRYPKNNRAESLELVGRMVEPRIAALQGSSPDWSTEVPVFEEYIVPLVTKYPEVDFIFFAPPISLARTKENLKTRLSGELVLRKKLADLANQQSSVSLYAFDLYMPVVSDMKYYKDTRHFTAAINKWMLQRMIAQDPRFAVSADAVVARGNALWDLIVEYYPTSTCTDIPETCGVFDPALHDPPTMTN
jgi:hypothetical protein